MRAYTYLYKVIHRPQYRHYLVGAICFMLLLFQFVAEAQDVAPTPSKKRKPPAAIVKKRRTGSSIIDDTTKHPYGPKTVLYTTERSLFYNKNEYSQLDTSFINMHRWTFIQKSNNFYKDLGNVGTAMSPIYPTAPSQVGATSGFTSYAPYYESTELKYFNTKSPYTNIYVVWGGNGRAITKIEFSRNIHKRWNFGLNYRPIWVDRQIQHQKAQRQTVSQYYDLYTTYKSTNDRYLLLFNYRRMRHRVSENGPVTTFNQLLNRNVPVSGGPGLFDARAQITFPPSLGFSAGAITEEYRSGIHLLQQYQLAKPFQLYSITDINTQSNKFTYSPTASIAATSAFDFSQGDSLNNKDASTIKVMQEEAGIKGNAGPLFYDYYFKLRSYQYENTYTEHDSSILVNKKYGLEKYVGARIALRIDSLTELSGNGELLLDGHYKLEGDFRSKFLDASIRSTLSKPGFMQMAYKGSHNEWSNNNFGNIATQQLLGFIKANVGPLFISPGATFTTLHNYIYFKSDSVLNRYQRVLPYQANNIVLFAPELRMTLTLFKKLSLRTQVIYSFIKSDKIDSNALQIPKIFANGQLSYENSFKKGSLNIQVGVDGHWQSSYYALGYATAIQQFYVQDVQNRVKSPAFPLVDVFLNVKIKRGRIFIKYQNLVQAFTKTGYMPTPYYPGQSNLLDFGFDILLFD